MYIYIIGKLLDIYYIPDGQLYKLVINFNEIWFWFN